MNVKGMVLIPNTDFDLAISHRKNEILVIIDSET